MSDTPRTDAEVKRIEDDEMQYPDLYDTYFAMLAFARQLERELGRTRQLLLDSERNLRWARERITEACKLEDALKQLLRPHPGQSLADAVTERVEDAFREGKSGRPFRTDDEDLAWIHSDARRSFNPPPKVELRAPALGDVDGQFGG